MTKLATAYTVHWCGKCRVIWHYKLVILATKVLPFPLNEHCTSSKCTGLHILMCYRCHICARATTYFLSKISTLHNYHGGVSNHQPHGCLRNRSFRPRSSNMKAPRHWPLCREFTGTIWCRHHEKMHIQVNVNTLKYWFHPLSLNETILMPGRTIFILSNDTFLRENASYV